MIHSGCLFFYLYLFFFLSFTAVMLNRHIKLLTLHYFCWETKKKDRKLNINLLSNEKNTCRRSEKNCNLLILIDNWVFSSHFFLVSFSSSSSQYQEEGFMFVPEVERRFEFSQRRDIEFNNRKTWLLIEHHNKLFIPKKIFSSFNDLSHRISSSFFLLMSNAFSLYNIILYSRI